MFSGEKVESKLKKIYMGLLGLVAILYLGGVISDTTPLWTLSASIMVMMAIFMALKTLVEKEMDEKTIGMIGIIGLAVTFGILITQPALSKTILILSTLFVVWNTLREQDGL